MISETESGLTSGQYADIQTATGDLSIEVNLQRYGPVWTSHDIGARTGSCFDAISVGDYLVRAHTGTSSDLTVQFLPDEAGGDEAWAAITNTLTDIDHDVPLSLVGTCGNGDTVRLFYYSQNGVIRYAECPDINDPAPSFGAPQNVGAVSGVIYLAAVSTTKVHYITKNSNDNRVFHVYEFNGSWSSTSSDIYWPFPIYAFDAETVGDFDLLMLASELSPLLGTRAIGTEVTTEVNRVQGLVTFRVKNGRWSDHQVTDMIDRVEASFSRTDLRLSYVNSILFACYERSGGADDYTYTKTAVTRSKDGENWEFPEFLTGVGWSNITAPVVILPRSDYLYAVGLARTARSPCCAWAGQTPVELDVTGYTMAIESQARDIRNSTLTVSNPGDTLAASLAKSDDRIQIVHDLGYIVSGSELRMTVSTEDIITRRGAETLPANRVTLRSQDRLGRLNRATSDYAAEWPSQQAGRDTYDDPSGTGYGGMRHTANIEGSWKTPKESINEIHLKSSNKEGLAVSTFVTDALNGSDQTAFKLHTDSEGEYAGLTFRVFDKDNLFFVAYYLDDDAIKLVKGVGKSAAADDADDSRDDTVLATSSSMSWVKDTWYWLKVRVRYSLVYVYYSTDGITWTLLDTGDFSSGYAEMAGTPDLYEAVFAEGHAIAWSGKFGLIGYGYSDDDTGPPWEPDPWEPFEPYVPQHWGVVLLNGSQIGRSWRFFADEDPTWEDIKSGPIPIPTGILYNIAIGPSRQAYVTSTSGLFYCANIAEATPNWSCLMTTAQMRFFIDVLDPLPNAHFQSVAVASDGTMYCGIHDMGARPGGYLSGTAGSLIYHAFPHFDYLGSDFDVKLGGGDRVTHCIWAGRYMEAGTGHMLDGVKFAVYVGLPISERAKVFTVGSVDYKLIGNTVDSGLFNPQCVYENYAVDYYGVIWSRDVFGTYTDIYHSAPYPVTCFGLDRSSSGSLLWQSSSWIGQDYLVRDGVLLATGTAVLGGTSEMFGRVIFAKGKSNFNEIIAVRCDAEGPAAGRYVVYTEDAFVNWHNKNGNWDAVFGNWAGSTGSSGSMGNAVPVCFPYSDEDYP